MKLQHKLLIATSFLAAISFNAVADSESNDKKPTKCSLATLKGTYIWSSQSPEGAYAGRDSFDGEGGVVTQLIGAKRSNGDSIVKSKSGSYTVNEDCTGTRSSDGETYNNFISPDGGSFSWVETDGSSVYSGIETRVSKALLVK
jgi:hypothetical protein